MSSREAITLIGMAVDRWWGWWQFIRVGSNHKTLRGEVLSPLNKVWILMPLGAIYDNFTPGKAVFQERVCRTETEIPLPTDWCCCTGNDPNKSCIIYDFILRSVGTDGLMLCQLLIHDPSIRFMWFWVVDGRWVCYEISNFNRRTVAVEAWSWNLVTWTI